MGKVSSGWIGGEDEDEKRRRLRELDQIRKNALGRKRDLRNKESIIHKPKSGLMKTLNQFASQRRKLEDATQINNLINKPRIIKQEVIQPRDLRGFFGAGIKGKELTRPDPVYEKYKNAVKSGDPFQLLNSATLCHRPEEKQRPNKSTKSPIEDDHEELKMEVSKILNNCNSSGSSMWDLDNPGPIKFPSSPVIGRNKGAKKKVNRIKPAEVQKNLQSQEQEVPSVNNANRVEKYRRRLFDEVAAGVNNKRIEVPKNVLRQNNEASRQLTPENVIFYSEVVSKEPVNKKKSKIDHLCADPDVMNYFVKISKCMGQRDLKNMFRDKYKDPEIKARQTLKLTYKRVLEEYAHNENCQPKSDDRTTTPSASSQILLEPDSHVVRVVKKNVAFQKQKESSASNSTDSTRKFVDKVNAQMRYPSMSNTVEDNIAKRKRVPSSKGSEQEVPSSTQAMADPKSARADWKMNSIHPYRQEIVARYLEDQKTFNSEASQPSQHRVRKDKLYISQDSDGTYLMQKSTKYVPAILRKNRSLADCVAKEKAAILSYEKYPSQREHDSSMSDLDTVESEHTPNTMVEPPLEAPNCKYAHANAKYNQPSRRNVPMVQDNSRHHRNPAAERHPRRGPSPRSFTLSQTYHLSPIQPVQLYADAGREFYPCQLSQASQASDNGQRLTRMVSFGDLQDRTSRLALCSQNQQCSQEAMEHAYASQQQQRAHHCQPPSNCNPFDSQPSFAEPLAYDRPSCECARCLRPPTYEYQPSGDYYREPCSCAGGGCCCRASNPAEPAMLRPVKFHKVEDSRRQPIYKPGESCTFARKQPGCYNAASSSRGAAVDGSSDFEYLDMLKMNYGGGGGGDRPQSFVAPGNGNQRYLVQRQASPPPAVCQQAARRHGHRAVNEAYAMNDAYLHQMNRQMHSKRQ